MRLTGNKLEADGEKLEAVLKDAAGRTPDAKEWKYGIEGSNGKP
jgi:hypothetical protein